MQKNRAVPGLGVRHGKRPHASCVTLSRGLGLSVPSVGHHGAPLVCRGVPGVWVGTEERNSGAVAGEATDLYLRPYVPTNWGLPVTSRQTRCTGVSLKPRLECDASN